MKRHLVTGISSFLFVLALAVAASAHADLQVSPAATRGFYGGALLRDAGTDSAGVNFGQATSVWNRFTAPTVDDSAARSLVFGGYRWSNDIALEAAFNSSDKYALRSGSLGSRRGGVGLTVAAGSPGLADVHSRTWNMDVYTSW